MPITVYGNTCKTRETYENDKFSIIENTDGTVSVYDHNLNPLTIHETKPCCELLGYTFDTNTQKCKWSLDNEELFKVVLNPEGNSSTLFEVEPNETCSLEVSFDYMFQFDCDNLVKTRADANGVSVSVQNEIDAIETELNNVTIECERYAALIQAESLIPYVIECYETTLDNYCLTSTGVTEFKSIITAGATGAAGATSWESSGGAVTTMYGCGEVNTLINTEPTPGLWITESCSNTIFDKKISNDKLVDINLKYTTCQAEELRLTTELGLKNSGTTTTDVCTEYIDMFEDFETAFTIEIETTGTTRLTSVYEEELLNIGTGNLYDYINTTSGQTGILISGTTTGLMPTLAETTLFSATTADLCTQVRDNLVSDLFNQYLVTNELPQTQQERIDIFTELTDWYQGCWLQHKTLITDPTLIGLLENEKINITISIKNCCVDFSILLDRIKMNKVCTKIDNVKRFVSEPPKFELTKVCDNKKSWIANTAADERFFDLKYRGTEYDTNHHKLVINTKEVDLNLSPSRAVEQDVWCYVGDNNCILEGCLSSGETFNAFSCPTGYTKDIDGDSCTQLTVTGVTSSATTYTVGSGVTLTRNIHYLSRGTIFVEDITDSQWPIFWSGTSKDSWVGPYYNTDYLTDSSGKFLNHSGFGSNKFTDGSLQYSSPAAFSGIKSIFGKNSADIVSSKLNPNILWGGTDGIVSGSSFVNVSGTLDAGRLLNASVWSNPGTLPIEEWIGLSYCLDLNETKTYRIGFAADDNVRLKVNGEYLINPVTTPDFDPNIHDNFSLSYSRSIQTYVVMGLTLSAGKNIIEVEGINAVSGIAGFVCELYDATEAQLKNIRYESELASVRIFSTSDRIGTTFDLGEKSGNSCPVGYSYDNCGPIQCTKIEKVTRDNEQLDEYCPCPDFPLIVKDYENVTLELPLTASTTPFTCNNIFTLTKSYGSTTTLEPIESIKGGDVYAIGVKSSTQFNGFWITEENDGSIGVYESTWVSGGTNTQENVTDQVDEACCLVIDKAFYTYADMFDQGINTYPSANWDFNLKKCVYTKCGDNGCINLDDVLTTELSQIDTVKEFASVLSSELIDVKNRQTLSSYPTLRMLYDRYNSRSVEFCGIDSSKYDYSDMDTFGQTVGNYWIDLIEQVVPATTIWGSTYAYKNTVFDQQKFNYKRGNLYLCDVPPIQLQPFDFLVIEYKWEQLIGGTDLDTRTGINGTGDPVIPGTAMGPDGNYIGWSTGTTLPSTSRKYVGPSSSPNDQYLIWGGDCNACSTSSEQVLVDFKLLSADYTSINDFLVDIRAFWHHGKANGDIEVKMRTYVGGTMGPDTAFGFTNTGGKVIDKVSFPTNVFSEGGGAGNPGELLGQVRYNATGKTATLTQATGSPATIPAPKPGPTGTTIMNPPVLASDATVGVCSEVLPNPIVPTTTTGTTVGQITIQPSITKCNGVWIKDDGCESDFLGTVTVMDRLGKIIPT